MAQDDAILPCLPQIRQGRNAFLTTNDRSRAFGVGLRSFLVFNLLARCFRQSDTTITCNFLIGRL